MTSYYIETGQLPKNGEEDNLTPFINGVRPIFNGKSIKNLWVDNFPNMADLGTQPFLQ